MTPKTFVFISRSGGGKGTQAKLLNDYMGKNDPEREIFYMYTGKEFREFIKGDSFTQIRSREIYDAGGRQPDYLAIYMWAHVLTYQFKGTEHLIFDGTPRSLNEATTLDSALTFLGREGVYIISINVSRKWSIDRLLERGRSDDTLENIERRLNWFDEKVYPAVEYYRNHSTHHFCEINGEQAIEEVHQEIIKKIDL